MTSQTPPDIYVPRRASRSRMTQARGIACHAREWGDPKAPLVVLLHGSQDASATFQFMVDECRGDHHFVAPDWRGHGQSGWAPQGYWFQDYLADLDAFLDEVSPGEPATIVGHSLGGNVACCFAGARPERVRRFVSLDGFGLADPDPAEGLSRLRRWLEGWRAGPEPSRPYPGVEALAARLRQAHPRLPMDKALFLAANTSRRLPSGEVVIAFDPRHRLPFAVGYRRAEFFPILRAIEAPALWLASDRPDRFKNEPGGWEERCAQVRNLRHEKVPDTSHNMHHDRPAEIARLVEAFLAEA